MYFSRLQITKKWQQFTDIDIDFHNNVTIITGANGSGKTTLVAKILARHCGWSSPSLATPVKDRIKGIFNWFNYFSSPDVGNQELIGKLIYSNGHESRILLPQINSAAYHVTIENQQSLNAMLIPSHRSLFRYQKIDQIPTNVFTKKQAFQQVHSIYTRRANDGYEDKSTSFLMKQSLLAWNLFGYSNNEREGNEKYIELFKGFESILRILLPNELGFKSLKVRDVEVVVECSSGDFVIDASSGGISAVLDLAWQIYMFGSEDEGIIEQTVIIDEIENHLHPKLQRKILPALVNAFPNTRFIVTTHSPLVIGSVKDSYVYVLRYNEKNEVFSNKLDLTKEAKTASEILDEVLGISFTMPIWAEDELNRIVSKYLPEDLEDSAKMTVFREELTSAGLGGFVFEGLEALMKK